MEVRFMIDALPRRLGAALLILAGLILTANLASAQSDPRYLRLASKVKGALYMPDSGEKPRIGILIMHEDSNFMNHIGCTEFSKRGYAVLCVNGRSDNNEALDYWDDLPLDAALGMRYLRETMKLPKVLLFAHSGGGPLLSYYEAVAENGPAICQGANRVSQCTDELKGLPAADGMITFDAHPGTAINMLRSLDPSVIDETNLARTDPTLDPFNPKNGFNPNGKSNYSAEFKQRYFKAQSARMNKLVAIALERRNLMKAGKYRFPDDDAFYIPRAGARLMEMDTSIDKGTVAPRRLLKNDGSIVTQIVDSVRKPAPQRAKQNRTFESGKLLTIRSFLGTRAIKSTDSMEEIDINSNNNSTPAHLQKIKVPILMMAAGGHYFIRDNEKMFDMAASPDKEFIVVEGAAHGIVPCKPCESTPGQYGNSVKNAFDYMKGWIDKRF
jgi:pimeloyl-ACP methyl ester carboxylesterase